MCIYCANGGHPAGPASAALTGPPPPFFSLQLTQANFDTYLARSEGNQRASMFGTPNLTIPDGPRVRISSANPDVQEVLRNASRDGAPAIEMTYSIMESLLWIMQRLEKMIRVPMSYWTLAGDGIVFTPGHLTMSLDVFKRAYGHGMPPAEITLLPTWEVESWTSANLRKPTLHKSADTRQTQPDSGVTDALQRATDKYDLIDPFPINADWARYMERRDETEKRSSFVTELYFDGADFYEYGSRLRETLDNVIKSIAGEDASFAKKLHRLVSFTKYDNQVDDNYAIRDLDIISRIHSPCSVGSVDVRLQYHYRTRWSSVEWSYTLGIRIDDEPSKPVLEYGHWNFPVDEQYTATKDVQNGWKQFAWFVLDNRDREHSQCVVSPGTMRTIHTTLFGGAGRPLAARIALKDTARLLLASVGIPFEIAEATGVDDGYDDEKYSSSSRLSLGRHAPGVSAARLRKVCGLAPLPGDNADSIAGRMQVTQPSDDEQEDYDDDEEEEEEW